MMPEVSLLSELRPVDRVPLGVLHTEFLFTQETYLFERRQIKIYFVIFKTKTK